MRDVVVLGSTGSIGTQALDVIAANPDRFRVVGLSATGARPGLIAGQVAAHRVPIVAVADAARADDVRGAIRAELSARKLPDHAVTLLTGPGSSAELATAECDVVLNGLSGAAGLRPTVAALEAGRVLALANKESLIIGGPLVKAMARPGQIVPVDSEHSAIAQALRGGSSAEVARLILTASGGPFRGWSATALAGVTPEQALCHPTWDMGALVTVNSATLVNKGLELIEAHLLFDVPFERMDVVVHPQSVVHSMVQFTDGSTLAQASPPDMRLPIAMGLAWPERVPGAAAPCDWTHPTQWTFDPVDHDTFPAVRLAARVGEAGGTAPAVFNAADEVAVSAFLSGGLSFPGIVDTIERVVDQYMSEIGSSRNVAELQDVLGADGWARERAAALIGRRSVT
ncbi:MAG: 1-deoxy-D-xylulose-5-phosphate reductoisomerase [Candidatus Nanopelagicales bacterium]|nr:1-deoxy-D-xylulose-5-phosphate reductoisomerase [Candidatus Nanopelagicales bacterium]MDZ4250147.1 1-deoxy-D-xylulose-5-phosphate reductoisomerase [Candidatus Nanopelagicales bacterium]